MLNPPRSILLGWAREAILLGPKFFIIINYSKHILLGNLILILNYHFEVKDGSFYLLGSPDQRAIWSIQIDDHNYNYQYDYDYGNGKY